MYNVRDMGGYTTTSNKTIAYGKLYRGAKMTDMTDTGRSQLFGDLGVKTELDLRTDGTSQSGNTTHKYVKYPMGQYTQIIPDYISPDRYTVSGNENIGPIKYSGTSVNALKDVFNELANPDNYPMYFHCNAGADRTGTVAFLLNGLLGVPYEQLVQDFELTTFSKSQARYRSPVVNGKFLTEGEHAGIFECTDNNYIAFGKLYELIMTNYASKTTNKTLQEGIQYYLTSVVGVTTEQIESIKTILLK